jgi:hypothetical protein
LNATRANSNRSPKVLGEILIGFPFNLDMLIATLVNS